jgi:protein-tyrosine phosphatase
MHRTATVTRLTDDQLRFQWPQGLFEAPVSVSWSFVPDGDASDFQLLTVVEQGNEAVLADPSPGRRPYFLLTTSKDQPMVIAERRLPLEGQANFRDLGGYATKDGRRVRWGQLYRSGDLSHLSDVDVSYLEYLDLKLVCDLRVNFEVKRAPDRLPEGVARLALPIRGGEIPEADLYATVDSGDLSGLDGDFLLRGNRMFVREFSPAYGQMVRQLAEEDSGPVVFHCTAGKDRAGLGAAIVLLVLGVPLETVFDDYLLSNTYRAGWTERMLTVIRRAVADRTDVPVESVDLSPIEALFVAKRAYLAAALDTINQQYGSFKAYSRDGLGMSPETQEAVQESLLE